MSKEAIIEASKEALRVAVLAGLGFLIAYFGDMPETSTTALVLLVLRFVDKAIHADKSNPRKGLLPF